jgi:Ca-activated chloride channel family protein
MTGRTTRSKITIRSATRIVLGAALLLIPQTALAQGWIEPRPGQIPAQWGIEKLRTNVTVRVTNRVAEVEVEEWFRNNGGGLGEGDYVYPLPGEAVFTGYSLFQGDQELRGEMMDAARARTIYENIVRAQKDPALIELIGKGMMRARVFPIEAGQTRRITLRYTQVLERAGDAVQFRYAAGARFVGGARDMTPLPMPQPGVPDRRESRPIVMAEAVPITFTMTIDDAAQYRDAFSPTHEVRIERSGGRMTVRPDGALRGDFAVFLPFSARAVGVSVAAHRPVGEDGYFMLTLSPAEVAASRVPRDVTVVVDVSGSMSGEKMEQARRALTQLLGTLGGEDRIRLIAFSNAVRPWRDGWARATRSELDDARAWVDALRAEGGTNIHDALETAFAEPTAESRLALVVFITDGLPTNGETRPDQIVAMAESRRGRARVFAFGVGYDVNTYLLDRLSAAARGTTQYVRPGEDVEDAIGVLAARVRHPVLTDLALERGAVSLTEVYPRELPDLFAGEELVLFGRYRGNGQSNVGVTGRRSDRQERYVASASFPARHDGNDYIPRLWAARKLGDLDRRIRSAQADGAGERQIREMVEELRTTALRYGLLSEYTSYLVLEPGMMAADGSLRLQGNVAAAPPPPAAVTGQAAVARAEEARRSREVTSVAAMNEVQQLASDRLAVESKADADGTRSGRRLIAGRTFELRSAVWHDVRHDERTKVIDVAVYSSAYFALIRTLPELALVLSEADSVLIAGRAVSIRVSDRGRVTALSDAELAGIVRDFR